LALVYFFKPWYWNTNNNNFSDREKIFEELDRQDKQLESNIKKFDERDRQKPPN